MVVGNLILPARHFLTQILQNFSKFFNCIFLEIEVNKQGLIKINLSLLGVHNFHKTFIFFALVSYGWRSK